MQRVRVSAQAAKDAFLVHPQPKQVSNLPRASFTVRRMARQASRRRGRTRALCTACIIHLIAGFFLIQFIRQSHPFDDTITVDFVEPIREKRTHIKKREIKPTVTTQPNVSEFKAASTTAKIHTEAARFKAPEAASVDLTPDDNLPSATLTTAVDLPHTGDITAGRTIGSEDYEGQGTGKGIGRQGKSGFDSFRGEGSSSGAGDAPTTTPDSDLSTRVDDDRLGAVLEGTPQELSGHIRIIRLKHSLSDWWQDPTAIPSFAKWLDENTQLRADMTYAGGSLPLTDDRILNAPLVIMTGHDKDVHVGRNLDRDGLQSDGFTKAERAQLRKYIIDRSGMLFFDDCGFNGLFAATVQNELRLTFPEYPLTSIPHTHEIYTIYYQLPRPPTGGDVFWKSENKAQPSKCKYQKGITINRRLAVVYNRKDYLCAMETAEIDSRTMLRMRRSNDVHRFMTNLLIYQMRYGGNTDRSQFER